MESNNPALRSAPQFQRGGYAGFDDRRAGSAAAAGTAGADARSLEEVYGAPSATTAHTGRMTYDDVVLRAGTMLGVVVVTGAVAYVVNSGLLLVVGVLGGLVLGLVNSLKREPSPVLMLTYAALQGLFVGSLSVIIDATSQVSRFGNSVTLQAVIATVAVFAVMLVLYKSGAVRATPRFRKIMLGAVLGYAVFGLVNLAFSLFGGGINVWSGGIGLLVGGVGAVLASLSLVLDFDVIEQGVRNGVPARYAWTAAFGLTVTLVWLYIEMLRLISILRSMVSD